MKYQTIIIPRLRNKISETPWQTEKTISESLLNKHVVETGKVALIVINKGSLEFMWEDDPELIYNVDSSHPLVIGPNREHHLIVHGRVDFKIEYYNDAESMYTDKEVMKPGNDYIEIIIPDEPIDKRIKR